MEEKINEIVSVFRLRGHRLTAQRRNLLSLILNNPECSCKELYYMAKSGKKPVGLATVYRTVSALREAGFVRRQFVQL